MPRSCWPLPKAVTSPPGLGSPPQRDPPITLPKSDPHLPQSFPRMSLAFFLRSSYHNLSLFLFFSLKTFLLKKNNSLSLKHQLCEGRGQGSLAHSNTCHCAHPPPRRPSIIIWNGFFKKGRFPAPMPFFPPDYMSNTC